ncbi:MAG TPA: EF-Tu/IF-2/RF-3 family GTPase, partial [Geobacteraceae bacterium]|nr:EF-Tu/IF-2/RF-3 family GTPase [Geobacteraceae bacterium]
WVNRPHLDFRGFCGTIAAGSIRPGDEVQVASSGRTSRVARVVTMNGDLDEGVAGQAVTLTLSDEIDISRGDMLSTPDASPRLSRHAEAHLVWMHDEPLQPGQVYLVKTASAVMPGRVSRIHYAVDVNTLEQNQAPTLGLNGIGVVQLELDRAVAFDPYRQNRDTGSFILIDRFSNATVAAGMVISAAPVETQTARPERGTEVTEEAGFCLRSVSLTVPAICGTEMGVADLTREWGPVEFEVSPGFLDYLGKGNRVLVRLRDVGQLEPVARMAYEHSLGFEFGRYRDRVNVILYKNDSEPVPQEPDLGGL